MHHCHRVIVALLVCLAWALPARAQGVIDPYTLFPAAGGGYTPQAVDCAGGNYLTFDSVTGMTDTDSGSIFGMVFRTPTVWSDSSLVMLYHSPIGQKAALFSGSDTTSPRSLQFIFRDNGGSEYYSGYTTTTFALDTEYAILFSWRQGVGGEMWVNGAEETVTSLINVTSWAANNSHSFQLCSYAGAAVYLFNGQVGPLWWSNEVADIDASYWAQYFDGSNQPLENGNNAEVWMKWDDYTSSGSGTASITNSGTTLGNW